MPTLQYLPPWSVDYSYGTDPSVIRTRNSGGYVRQSRVMNKRIVTASATRELNGIELPYFEYFVRTELLDGSKKFTDSYADHNGLVVGTIRILGGEYSVRTNRRGHTVSCEIEIFR